MAFISEDSLQAYSYAGSEFHAPQIFRQEVFAGEHLSVGLCLDGYLFFIAGEYLVIFPAFFLRFNEDGTISFLAESQIRKHRRNIFGIPLFLVSDLAADGAEPRIRTGRLNQGRTLPGQDAPRILTDVPESVPAIAAGQEGIGSLQMELTGTLFRFGTEDLEKYNQFLYSSPDYVSTLNLFNEYLFRYHRELDELAKADTLFPVRELRRRRHTRREAVSGELTKLSRQIFALEEELADSGFAFTPLRMREKKLLKQRIRNLKEKQAAVQEKYQYL